MGTALLDDNRIAAELLDEVLHATPASLTDARPRRGPGVYVMTYVGPLVMYAKLLATGYPIYVGKTVDLSDRMSRHRRNLVGVVDLDPDHLVVRWLEATRQQIPYFEELLHEQLQPLWVETWLAGFGSRVPGSERMGGRTPAWSVLHPGRNVATGAPRARRSELERRVADHLEAYVPEHRIWPDEGQSASWGPCSGPTNASLV